VYRDPVRQGTAGHMDTVSPLPRATPNVILSSHLKGLRAAQIIRAARWAVGEASRGAAESLRIGRHAPFPARVTLITVREAIRQRHERRHANGRIEVLIRGAHLFASLLSFAIGKGAGLVQSIAVDARRVERYVTVTPWRAL
jgi:hypothetical protein